jgi:hypothetical protein
MSQLCEPARKFLPPACVDGCVEGLLLEVPLCMRKPLVLGSYLHIAQDG